MQCRLCSLSPRYTPAWAWTWPSGPAPNKRFQGPSHRVYLQPFAPGLASPRLGAAHLESVLVLLSPTQADGRAQRRVHGRAELGKARAQHRGIAVCDQVGRWGGGCSVMSRAGLPAAALDVMHA